MDREDTERDRDQEGDRDSEIDRQCEKIDQEKHTYRD